MRAPADTDIRFSFFCPPPPGGVSPPIPMNCFSLFLGGGAPLRKGQRCDGRTNWAPPGELCLRRGISSRSIASAPIVPGLPQMRAIAGSSGPKRILRFQPLSVKNKTGTLLRSPMGRQGLAATGETQRTAFPGVAVAVLSACDTARQGRGSRRQGEGRDGARPTQRRAYDVGHLLPPFAGL